MKTNYDAFISYGRADSKSLAIKLQDTLSELGFISDNPQVDKVKQYLPKGWFIEAVAFI